MSEPTMVEQLGNHVLKQLPKNLGYDQRIKIMHGIQDFVRQWGDREQKAEWDLDAINDRLQTERDEALAALRNVMPYVTLPAVSKWRAEHVEAKYDEARKQANAVLAKHDETIR